MERQYFPSSYIDEILTDLIEKSSLRKGSIEKWHRKMKNSVLKSISISSKRLFVKKSNLSLSQEISALKRKIEQSKKNIMSIASTSLKSQRINEDCMIIPTTSIEEPKVIEKIDRIHGKLISLKDEVGARVRSFELLISAAKLYIPATSSSSASIIDKTNHETSSSAEELVDLDSASTEVNTQKETIDALQKTYNHLLQR